MTDAPTHGPDVDPEGKTPSGEAHRGAAPYPPPYDAHAHVGDDELASALAAQTAMYTGPITIPVLNSDPTFRPDPDAVDDGVPPPPEFAAPPVGLPPVPVPPPPTPTEYIAPDVVAADPEASAFPAPEQPVFAVPHVEAPAPEQAAEALPVFEMPVFEAPVFDAPAADPTPEPFDFEQIVADSTEPVAQGTTLDAILKLEDELRRRQVLPPDLAAPDLAAPAVSTPAPSIDEPSIDELLRSAMPPVATEASFAPPPAGAPAPLPGIPLDPAPTATPGWVPAPDPQNEGQVAFDASPSVASAQPWLAAPPPSFAPPALVEPPPPGEAGFDRSALTAPPIAAPAPPISAGIDVTTLPPPGATPPKPVSIPAGFAPSDFFAPAAVSAPAEAFVVGSELGDPDAEGIDDIDRADVVSALRVDTTGVVDAPPAPVGVVPLATDATDIEPRDPHPFEVERAAVLPTPLEQRAGKAARTFWLWFAANSSFISVAVGATMLATGLSLRQALVATLLGIVLSTIPLGLGTRAGKWSGQPTMVVSRATFGHIGNIVPTMLSILGRVFWGGVIVWLLAVSIAPVVPGDERGGLTITALGVLGAGVIVAALVAVVGFGLLYRVQLILGILSSVLVVATIVVTFDRFDASVILRTDEGSWVLALGGAVLVFSVIGLTWAQSSSDLARYQRPGSSTGATSVWSILGTVAAPIAIISWGAILAASNPASAESLASDPLGTLLEIVPPWFAVPLIAVAGIGLVSAAIITIYSGGLAINSAGIRMPRPIATLVAAILVGGIGFILLAIDADARDIVQDFATTLAVPVAAWVGIFGGEMMLRTRRFHSPSLQARGGVYPAVRWVNLVGLFVISGIGFGLTSAEVPGLDWQGYLLSLVGVTADSPWVGVDAGVLAALILGLVLAWASSVPAIRRQEQRGGSTGTPGMPVVDALVD